MINHWSFWPKHTRIGFGLGFNLETQPDSISALKQLINLSNFPRAVFSKGNFHADNPSRIKLGSRRIMREIDVGKFINNDIGSFKIMQ